VSFFRFSRSFCGFCSFFHDFTANHVRCEPTVSSLVFRDYAKKFAADRLAHSKMRDRAVIVRLSGVSFALHNEVNQELLASIRVA
jgi:hypothetical protein